MDGWGTGKTRTLKKTATKGVTRMTTEDYLMTPETVLPQELIYGVFRAADAPTPPHQSAVGDFYLALTSHVREHSLGDVWLSPIDVILDEARALVVQPDLLFISNARRHILTDRIRGAPDMVLEVLSPHPRIGRLGERVRRVAKYGVLECGLLHQAERRREVVSFDDGAVSARVCFDERAPIRSAVLPDFRRTLASILRCTY
jgi:Uma2 family endonuclease